MVRHKILEWISIGAITVGIAVGGMFANLQQKNQAAENKSLKDKVQQQLLNPPSNKGNTITLTYPPQIVQVQGQPQVKIVIVKQPNPAPVVQVAPANPIVESPAPAVPNAPSIPPTPTIPNPTPAPKGIICKNIGVCL